MISDCRGESELYAENVAEILKRFDVSRKWLQFTAEVREVRVEVVHFNVHVFPKHMDQVVFMDHSVWILREYQKKLIFFRRKTNRLVVKNDLMTIEIDNQILELNNFIIL